MVDIASILSQLSRAADLFDQATELYERVKPSIDNVTAGSSQDLAQARQRLEASMQRARTAHSELDAAIAKRLGE